MGDSQDLAEQLKKQNEESSARAEEEMKRNSPSG
jgi:hypothetical protein